MSERLTSKQYLQQTAKPKRNKYGAKRTVVDGILFDSKAEAARYGYLKARQEKGEISHLERQPKFKLYGKDGAPVLIKSARYPRGRHAVWRGDFAYFCPVRNKRVCEDVKGVRTQVYILKRAIVEACYPGLLIVEI